MTADANKQTIRRFYDEVWHTNGRPAFDTYLTPEASGYRQQIEEIRAAYPDVYFDLGEMVADDSAVVARWTWRGTHRTEGEHSGSGVSIWHLRDGKILDRWTCADPTTVSNMSRLR